MFMRNFIQDIVRTILLFDIFNLLITSPRIIGEAELRNLKCKSQVFD